MMKNRGALIAIVLIVLVALVGVLFLSPIPQDSNYHNFADGRTILTSLCVGTVFTHVDYASALSLFQGIIFVGLRVLVSALMLSFSQIF